MWPRRSHTLAPLTISMSINRKFKWAQVEQDAFDKIKRIMARNNLLTYPGFNETFKIHTNASAFRLGAVVSQKVKPIAFYSRELTYDKQWYKVTEREILSIVETVREFRTILFGYKLRVYTDHKNLTRTKINTNIVLRCRVILE